MKGLSVAIGLTFAVVSAVFVQFVMRGTLAAVEQSVHVSPANPQGPAGPVTVENAPGGVLTFVSEQGARTPRNEILALVNPDVLSASRAISVDIALDAATLLSSDETMPADPELADLLVATRSRHLSRALCEELAASFVASCQPVQESVRLDRSGLYVVTARLLYTPSSPYGAIPQSEHVLYRSMTLDLPRQQGAAPERATADQLAALGDQVTSLCAEIRQKTGGCGPLAISIQIANLTRGPAGLAATIEVRAELGWIEPAPANPQNN